MAFAPHVIRESARVRHEDPRTPRRRFVRRRALGTEAIYEIVEEGRDLVTAEVVAAPGLAAGTRFTLLASDARAMDEVSAEEFAAAPDLKRSRAGSPQRAA